MKGIQATGNDEDSKMMALLRWLRNESINRGLLPFFGGPEKGRFNVRVTVSHVVGK